MQWKGFVSRLAACAGVVGVIITSLSGCGGGGGNNGNNTRAYAGSFPVANEETGVVNLSVANTGVVTGRLDFDNGRAASGAATRAVVASAQLTGTANLATLAYSVTGTRVLNGVNTPLTITGNLPGSSGSGTANLTYNGATYAGLLTSTAGGVITPPNTSGRAACQVKPRNTDRARWTVLIFLNAANDLQPDSLLNVAQMAKVGSDGTNLNIVVQWKQQPCPNNSFGCGNPSFNATRRYLLRQHSQSDQNRIKNGDTSVLDSDMLPMNSAFYNAATKQIDMGDWRAFKDFIQWGSTAYPADNLAVLVWNHGAGWEPTRAAHNKPTFRAVSIDNASGNEIATEQLPGALAGAAQPIDALIFDASLMQMAEVAYEVRNSAKVMIGSEESPPGEGYPYDQWLADLKSSGSDACTLGQSIVTRFVNANTGQTNITQSVLDLSKMQAVANAMNAFGTSLRQHGTDQSSVIVNARQTAQRYDYPEYKDLYDFSRLIAANATAADLQTAALNVQQALTGTSGAVISNGHNLGRQGSFGLAVTIYNPNILPSVAPNYTLYNNLAIAKSGGAPAWAQFLQNQSQ